MLGRYRVLCDEGLLLSLWNIYGIIEKNLFKLWIVMGKEGKLKFMKVI